MWAASVRRLRMTDRCIAALIFALGYAGILAWLYVRIRNDNPRDDATGDDADVFGAVEGGRAIHFDSASNSISERDHG